MVVVYRLQGVEFEWDDQKAQLNILNHGITFEEAAEVFFDPFYQYGDATPAEVQEQRDFILGIRSRNDYYWWSPRNDTTAPASYLPDWRLGPRGNTMSQAEFPTELHLRPRPSAPVTLTVPTDTLSTLEAMAANRDMSVEALMKLYIGQGLRQDVAQRFADRVLDLTAQVLTRHGQSQEQVDAIVREIRNATAS